MKFRITFSTLIWIVIVAVILPPAIMISRYQAAATNQIPSKAKPRSSYLREKPEAASLKGKNTEDHQNILIKRLRAILSRDTLDRSRALLVLMKGFGSQDFPIALKTCREFSGRDGSDAANTIAREWASRDPESALSSEESWIKLIAFSTWAGKDESAARQWMETNALEEHRDTYLALLVLESVEEDSERGMQQLNNLNPAARDYALERLITSNNPATLKVVMEWTNALENTVDRVSALKVVFDNWDNTHATDKMNLLLGNPQALDQIDLARPFRQWARADPGAACAALDQFPPGIHRQDIIAEILPDLLHSGELEHVAGIISRHPDELDKAAGSLGDLVNKPGTETRNWLSSPILPDSFSIKVAQHAGSEALGNQK